MSYCVARWEKSSDANSILGSTYTGVFESVQGMSDELDKYEKETGHYVPIHVDAASGGFVAPFAYPQYVWDFKIPRVHSINASGHKYGMSQSFPPCGFIFATVTDEQAPLVSDGSSGGELTTSPRSSFSSCTTSER